MHTKTFQFLFEELDILPSDIELLLGFNPGSAPHPFPDMIRSGLAEAGAIINLSAGYRKFYDISAGKNEKSVTVGGQIFYPGRYAYGQFENAVSAAIFVCTAGGGISGLITGKTDTGNYLESYITDLIGTVAVEKCAERIRKKLEEDAGEEGLNITSSFSPGYCDWDVAEQQKLFKLLPDQFCGVKLSSSSLMNPVKSLSGIICAGPDIFEAELPCFRCRDWNCLFGKLRRLKKL